MRHDGKLRLMMAFWLARFSSQGGINMGSRPQVISYSSAFVLTTCGIWVKNDTLVKML